MTNQCYLIRGRGGGRGGGKLSEVWNSLRENIRTKRKSCFWPPRDVIASKQHEVLYDFKLRFERELASQPSAPFDKHFGPLFKLSRSKLVRPTTEITNVQV